MTNLTLGYPTHTSRATAGPWTGSWVAGYPAANLTSLPLGRVARSIGLDPAQTRFEILLPEDLPVGMVTLVNHNLSNAATVQVLVYGDSGATLLRHDSGPLEAWPAVYKTATLKWEDRRWWTGKYNDYEKTGNVPVRPMLLPETVSGRLIRVLLSDPANPDGFVQVGYCDVADTYTPSINMKYGSKFGIRSRSVVVEAEGGAKYGTKRGDVKYWQMPIDYLPEDEASDFIIEMQSQLGVVDPLMIIPFPDKPWTLLRQCFLSRQVQLNPVEKAFFGRDSVLIELEEVR